MFDAGDDFTVDVLVIGAGAQGRYVAKALAPSYSVCVLSDPAVPAATLDAPGLLSAGYTGNDAVRMQAARRTAGYWRHWAEVSGAAGATTPTYVSLPDTDVATTTRLWDEAGLGYARTDLPYVFSGGRISASSTTFRVDDDVVVDPGDLLRSVTPRGVPFVDGHVVRFRLDGDSAIGHVDVETLRGVISIAPRFVVLAAGVHNPTVLSAIARRSRRQPRRRDAGLAARRSQVVVEDHVVVLRSAQLPALAGTFGDLDVVAHPVAWSPDVVWLVTGRPGLQRLNPGDAELRFDPPVDSARVAEIVDRLRTASPLVAQKPRDIEWSVYVTREAVHPVVSDGGEREARRSGGEREARRSGGERAVVGTPLPARLDRFGLDGFVALWPSHLGYTMLLGDVVAERVAADLGESAGSMDRRLAAVARTEPPAVQARWWSPSLRWHDWPTFAASHGVPTR